MSDKPKTCSAGKDVTRVKLVDETGRVYDRTGVKVDYVYQDDGKTLMVMITPLPKDEEIRAETIHRDSLAESFNQVRSLVDHLMRPRHE